jgi:hypothetical protein
MSLFTPETEFLVYMDSRKDEVSQEIHGREGLRRVFESLSTYEATTHFNVLHVVELVGRGLPHLHDRIRDGPTLGIGDASGGVAAADLVMLDVAMELYDGPDAQRGFANTAEAFDKDAARTLSIFRLSWCAAPSHICLAAQSRCLRAMQKRLAHLDYNADFRRAALNRAEGVSRLASSVTRRSPLIRSVSLIPGTRKRD